MLSYVLSVDDKPPPCPTKTHHLQLSLGSEAPALTNGTSISKETSVSSFASNVSTTTASQSSVTPSSTSDKTKPKLLINGAKHQTLKRVSFGSSKGSMVETLIFESPVQEEPEPSPIPENPTPFPEDLDQTIDEREKVRVSFFQQSKPQEVDLPDEPIILESEYIMAVATAMNDANHISYNRQESTDSGWDNPFRPGGDLSREADEIVQLIKGGKPITPTSGGGDSPVPPHFADQIDHAATNSTHPASAAGAPRPGDPITESPKRATANALNSAAAAVAPSKTTNSTAAAAPNAATNGSLQNDAKTASAVDVQRGTIVAQTPSDANQVEHVVIKKKPKCKCCVIQ